MKKHIHNIIAKLNFKNKPHSATVTEIIMKYFVGMHDKYLSGWGMAANKMNYMIVICDSMEQAETIKRNAERRPEMANIGITTNEPSEMDNVLYSWYTYDELGYVWKKP